MKSHRKTLPKQQFVVNQQPIFFEVAAIILLVALSSCARVAPFKSSLSAREECKILYKNRTEGPRPHFVRQKAMPSSRQPVAKRSTNDTRAEKNQIFFEAKQVIDASSSRVIGNVTLFSEVNVTPYTEGRVERKPKQGGRGNEFSKGHTKTSVPRKHVSAEKVGKPRESHLPRLLGASLVLSWLGLLLFRKRLRILSSWAAAHPKTTRTLLTSIHAMIGVGALATGYAAHLNGISIPYFYTAIGLVCVGGMAIFYPVRNSVLQFYPAGYTLRKAFDSAAFTAGVVLALGVGNNSSLNKYVPASAARYFTHVSQIPVTFSENNILEPEPVVPVQKKPLALSLFLTVLSIGAFAGLFILVSALACNLACSGFEALAAFVLLLGWAGSSALLVYALRKIWKRERLKNESIS